MVPKRVLIVGMATYAGGIESYIMELYRHIDRERIQFDFLNCIKGKKLAYEDEIVSLGGRVYYVPMIRDGLFLHFLRLHKLFKENQYSAVYFQASSKPMNTDVLRIAEKYCVRLRILHAHASDDLHHDSLLRKFRKASSARILEKCLTHRFCCSRSAGEYIFGKEAHFTVINNGIEPKKFIFDPVKRSRIQKLENAQGNTVYGTVARLSPEKNPLFLVEVFREIHRMQPNSVFWHIGDGPLESLLREKIYEYNLEDSYYLLGWKDNVSDYYSAMDLLFLPSLHESFGIALLEAQTSGLRCLVADTIPPETNVTGDVLFLPLSQGPQTWAKTAITLSSYERHSHQIEVVEAGYDVGDVANKFEQLILRTGM